MHVLYTHPSACHTTLPLAKGSYAQWRSRGCSLLLLLLLPLPLLLGLLLFQALCVKKALRS